MYNKKKKAVNCLTSLTEENVTSECNDRLQNKVWKPGKLKPVMKCDDNKDSGEFQHKVWDPGGMKTECI